MPRSRTEDESESRPRVRQRQSRSRSPPEDDNRFPARERRRSPAHKRPRHEKSRHTTNARGQQQQQEEAVRLPFSARPLVKSDYETLEPLFAYYLDLQKQKDLWAMDERETRGRWKSFMGKWNRGELAEGWYDPDTFAGCRSEYVRDPSPIEEDGEPAAARASPGTEDSDEDDEHGATPSSAARQRVGATRATIQDLALRDELAREEREAERQDARQARRAERTREKERLEELVPRAEPGTRERRLEKKKETNDKMRQFRDRSPGLEVGDDELMGQGDELAEHKKAEEQAKKRKSERQLRREEFDRARKEEMEEKRRAWQEREEYTVTMLRELARQRFG